MRILKLIHPKLGLCAQEVVYCTNPESKIKYRWKCRYGKKFYECSIEVEDDSPVLKVKQITYLRPDRFSKITEDIVFEVLRLLQKGHKRDMVCKILGISLTTVDRIRKNKKNNEKPYYTAA